LSYTCQIPINTTLKKSKVPNKIIEIVINILHTVQFQYQNIHTSPTKGTGRGLGESEKTLSTGEVWIFSGTKNSYKVPLS